MPASVLSFPTVRSVCLPFSSLVGSPFTDSEPASLVSPRDPLDSKLSTSSSLPGGSSYLNTSNNHNDLFYMAGTGLDRGGSALSALPEYGSSAYGPQRNSPNPYMSQWQGSSQHRSSTKTIGSRFSSLLQSSTFEEASMNFKGKSCWWNKNNNKRFKKTKKLPNTSSREFEKSMRDRYGHVKV